MSTVALLLVLGSAALHAAWNMLLAGARDTHAVTAVALTAGVLALTPAAVATWEISAGAMPYAAASVLLQLAYFALLATAYAGAALAAVYPIARGVAPVIALLVSVALLDAPVTGWQAAGVIAVGAGVLLVRGWRARTRTAPGGRRARAGGLPLALPIAACIAGYTLVDDHGVRHAAPLAYYEVVLGVGACAYVAAVAARRGAGALRDALGWRAALAGVGMAAAYATVLVALQHAEAAPVAALRETSVVMATVAAALTGREHVPAGRLAGAAVVVVGVAAIALG